MNKLLMVELKMQVVRGVDAFHSNMGSLLVLLHPLGVRLLQRSAGESLPARHRRPARLSHRHRRPLLRRLPRLPLPPTCLQSQPHRPPLPKVSLPPRFTGLSALGRHLQGKLGLQLINFNFKY